MGSSVSHFATKPLQVAAVSPPPLMLLERRIDGIARLLHLLQWYSQWLRPWSSPIGHPRRSPWLTARTTTYLGTPTIHSRPPVAAALLPSPYTVATFLHSMRVADYGVNHGSPSASRTPRSSLASTTEGAAMSRQRQRVAANHNFVCPVRESPPRQCSPHHARCSHTTLGAANRPSGPCQSRREHLPLDKLLQTAAVACSYRRTELLHRRRSP